MIVKHMLPILAENWTQKLYPENWFFNGSKMKYKLFSYYLVSQMTIQKKINQKKKKIGTPSKPVKSAK